MFQDKQNNSFYWVGTTRFNDETLLENRRFVENKLESPWRCIYPSPKKINSNVIPLNGVILVIEMNNEQNQVCGFSKIKNYLYAHENVYRNRSYNEFIYKGTKHVPREMISPAILCDIEKKVFKGSRHLKRGYGIMKVPQDKFTPEEIEYIRNILN